VNEAIVRAQSAGEPKVTTRHVLAVLVEDATPAISAALTAVRADIETLTSEVLKKPATPEP
jgi:hypothetical protein